MVGELASAADPVVFLRRTVSWLLVSVSNWQAHNSEFFSEAFSFKKKVDGNS